jgi:hypothetical protein
VTSLIATETLKLRTTRALWIATGSVLAITGIILVVNVALAGQNGAPPLDAGSLTSLVRAPVRLTGAVALVLGLLLAAGEHRFRTVLTSRLAEPRTGRLLAARVAAVAALGAGIGLLITVLTTIAGVAVLAGKGVAVQPLGHGLPLLVVLASVVVALHGVIGVALGTALRSAAGALGVALVWAFVVEGIVPVGTRSPDMTRWQPTGVADAAVHTGARAAGAVPPLVAVGVLAGYAAVLTAVAAVADRREI